MGMALVALAAVPTGRAQETKIGLSRNVPAQFQVTHLVTNVCQGSVSPRITYTGRYSLTGTLDTNLPCDELSAVLPYNAVFKAGGLINLRSPDFRGLHNGAFKILVGSTVVITGSMNGTDGVGTHRSCEPCDLCNHIEGLLRGKFVSGPLSNCVMQATYAGTIDSTCQFIPTGGLNLAIDGVVVCTNCLNAAVSE
jgi:hypothetical protein